MDTIIRITLIDVISIYLLKSTTTISCDIDYYNSPNDENVPFSGIVVKTGSGRRVYSFRRKKGIFSLDIYAWQLLYYSRTF